MRQRVCYRLPLYIKTERAGTGQPPVQDIKLISDSSNASVVVRAQMRSPFLNPVWVKCGR